MTFCSRSAFAQSAESARVKASLRVEVSHDLHAACRRRVRHFSAVHDAHAGTNVFWPRSLRLWVGKGVLDS